MNTPFHFEGMDLNKEYILFNIIEMKSWLLPDFNPKAYSLDLLYKSMNSDNKLNCKLMRQIEKDNFPLFLGMFLYQTPIYCTFVSVRPSFIQKAFYHYSFKQCCWQIVDLLDKRKNLPRPAIENILDFTIHKFFR
jgi:hypothetical protein